MKLDQFDVSLLANLQVDNRLTTEELGLRVGLSATAVQRRIKRLREAGAILGDVSILSPEVIGNRMTLIVQVSIARGQVAIVDTFKRDMRKVEEVQQCYYVTGEYDFVLVMTVKDMVDYDRLIRKIFFDNPDIARFHTIVVMEAVKRGFQIPL